MIERLSHEPASVPADDDGRSDRLQALELLRAQVSRTVSEGLERGSVAGQSDDIDNAQIAAFLDGSLSRAEWDAVATRLVDDPATRAEVAGATALLDEIQTQPATVPAGLLERAAGVLAVSEQTRSQVSAAPVTPVAWFRRSMAWSGFALAALAVIAVPAVLKIAGDGTTIAVKPSDPGDTFSRGIVATPGPTKKKDGQSCLDANEQARKSAADNARNDRGASAEWPAENNDPCGPKPAEAVKRERAAPAGSN
jgi:hypothetical protein